MQNDNLILYIYIVFQWYLYKHILFRVWRGHENTSPYPGGRINKNYGRIISHDGVCVVSKPRHLNIRPWPLQQKLIRISQKEQHNPRMRTN